MRSKRLLMPALVAMALAGFASAVDACSSDPTSASAPPPLPTGKPLTRDASVPEAAAPPIDASPIDAGAQARHFTGTLATTAAAAFGGSPHCKYTITLKQISVDITLTGAGAGAVAAASVTDLAVEADVPPCPNPPQDPTIHTFTLASSLTLPSGGLHLELAPDPANRPAASLVLEGDFSGDHVSASLEWHRTDQQPPLDWRVTTTVPLDRR